MTSVRLTVPGRISGKGRARFTTIGGFARAYTPKKTRTEEQYIATLAKGAMSGLKPFEGPLWLDIVIVQHPPASWSKAKRAEANWITTSNDLDNAIKQISDACNEVIYVDDRQIAKISAERVWRNTGEERVEITVHDLSAEPWAR